MIVETNGFEQRVQKEKEFWEEFDTLIEILQEHVTLLKEEGIPAGEREICMEIYDILISDILPWLESEIEQSDYTFKSEPMPLETVKIPPFPHKCLPVVLANYVEAVSENTQTPLEMGGVLALGVLAAVMQGRCKVVISKDYGEQLSLYTAAIAVPGERKSSVNKHFTAPVTEFEMEYNKKFKHQFEKNKIQKRILEGEIKKLETKAIRCGADEDTMNELDAKTQELANFVELHWLRVLVNDITAEKLIDLLDEQGGRIAISSAEGNLFDLLTARNERGTTLIEPMLKGYSGDRLTVDRMTRKGNVIDKPHISTILTVQPHVIDKVMANNEFSGKGLISRFLFVRCGSFIGERSSTSPEIPDAVKSKYRDLIFDMMNLTAERTFLLSSEAEEERQRFYDIIEKRLLNEWHFMRDFGAKFRRNADSGR